MYCTHRPTIDRASSRSEQRGKNAPVKVWVKDALRKARQTADTLKEFNQRNREFYAVPKERSE